MQERENEAMLEFALFALPSLIYFLVRGRTRDAAQVLGLRWPNLSGWLYGAAPRLISIAIAWTATIGVPAAVLHGSGTSGRIVNAWGALAVVLAAPARNSSSEGSCRASSRGTGVPPSASSCKGSPSCFPTCFYSPSARR